MFITVAICTHNPRPHYLGRVLEGLRGQSLANAGWELLVIDNASTDPLADSLDLSWHPAARILREDSLGLTPARQRAIREAAGELIVFVDDDNILNANYLEVCVKISESWPMLGIWGGQQLPEFEADPPQWVNAYRHLLALHAFEKDSWSNNRSTPLPCGAGMCLRIDLARSYSECLEKAPLRRTLDRKGSSLACCGDTDIALLAFDSGYGAGRFTALKLTHLIPTERLSEDYLLQVAEQTPYSWNLLLALRGEWRPTSVSLLQRLSQWRYERTLDARTRRFLEAERSGTAKAEMFIRKHFEPGNGARS